VAQCAALEAVLEILDEPTGDTKGSDRLRTPRPADILRARKFADIVCEAMT